MLPAWSRGHVLRFVLGPAGGADGPHPKLPKLS